MLRLLILPLLFLLTACPGPLTSIPEPRDAADRIVLDEQLATGVELAYKAARIACEIGVDAGLIRGENATRFRDLNRRAYAAVQTVRTAYRAGNARDYVTALAEAQGAVDDLLSLTGRNQP